MPWRLAIDLPADPAPAGAEAPGGSDRVPNAKPAVLPLTGLDVTLLAAGAALLAGTAAGLARVAAGAWSACGAQRTRPAERDVPARR